MNIKNITKIKNKINNVFSFDFQNKDEYEKYFYENRKEILDKKEFGVFKINSKTDLFDYKKLFQNLENTNGSFLLTSFFKEMIKGKIYEFDKYLFLELENIEGQHKIFRFFDKETLNYIGRFELIHNNKYFGNVYIDNEEMKGKGIMTNILINFIIKKYGKVNQGIAVSEEMMFFLKKMEKLGHFTFKEKGNILGYYH